MGFHDRQHILFVLDLGTWSGGGECAHGCGTGALGAGIHISLVVVADIDEVGIPLGSSA